MPRSGRSSREGFDGREGVVAGKSFLRPLRILREKSSGFVSLVCFVGLLRGRKPARGLGEHRGRRRSRRIGFRALCPRSDLGALRIPPTFRTCAIREICGPSFGAWAAKRRRSAKTNRTAGPCPADSRSFADSRFGTADTEVGPPADFRFRVFGVFRGLPPKLTVGLGYVASPTREFRYSSRFV